MIQDITAILRCKACRKFERSVGVFPDLKEGFNMNQEILRSFLIRRSTTLLAMLALAILRGDHSNSFFLWNNKYFFIVPKIVFLSNFFGYSKSNA